MSLVLQAEVECPHCGEPFSLSVDTSGGSYSTIEDCWVCCRPIEFGVECEPGELLSVQANRA